MNLELILQQLLLSREKRKEKQHNLIKTYGKGVISFMVNMPGAAKDTALSRQIHEIGMQLLDQFIAVNHIKVLYRSVENKVTGTEGYLVLDYPAKELKRRLIEKEDKHPIGRLFDFDVIDENYQILSRTMFNKSSRKCLICNEEAAICRRTQKHTYEQIIQKMEDMVLKNNL
ncbi:citrate lyase holo-[acyl-carrier protein] synthase [Cellulosilyticum sp. I15G10I2]|uniref:citrate lyase holo-[acyl-carrier protein] synthase n=1 Tax=Cellulosilyticum sp. I15G10I2 TaxID=1892843 RepID=UPI00085C8A06|nr:citrate lyase holo-[acyl-carrier protein] synthase [Cellulosilyticum sp. I15G10I2]